MKPVCLACDVTPLDSRDRDLKPGERGITGWRITNPPKHGGGCSEHWPGIGKTEPQDSPRAAEEEVTLDDLVRDANLQEARDHFAVMRPGPPAPRISPITGRDSVGEIATFHYGTCDCGCGQTFDRCKTRTPDEAFQAAKAQYAAKRNGKPVVQRSQVPRASGGVNAPKRRKGRK